MNSDNVFCQDGEMEVERKRGLNLGNILIIEPAGFSYELEVNSETCVQDDS